LEDLEMELIEGIMIGGIAVAPLVVGLVALAKKRDAFTEQHERLLSSVAQPFTIALVNALQHREIVLHKNRLA
jgi:hypothetical protein